MNDGELGWQQNINNICQGVATPFAAWLLAAYVAHTTSPLSVLSRLIFVATFGVCFVVLVDIG